MAFGENTYEGRASMEAINRPAFKLGDPTKQAFFWLSAFFVVYCARPEDWVPGLKFIPLAKITAIFAIWGLFNSLGRTKRTLKDLPKESRLLLTMIILLFIGGFLSPVWKGGAVNHTIDFSKVYIAFVLVFLLITTFDRLRRIIFIQAFSVVLICAVALVKGHSTARLDSVIGGIYSNPNDLAFAIVLSLPFALAFMVTSKSPLKKAFWLFGMLIMLFAMFETASRAGFIDLVISGAVTLYYFAVKGNRMYLLVATAFVGIFVAIVAGGTLYDRFEALSGASGRHDVTQSAYGSYEQRKELMVRALSAIEEYPVFGVGMDNFVTYSRLWRDVHMTYLQICAEGGIPVLILYLMFFRRAFQNLKTLRTRSDLDHDIILFVGALTSSLVGFAVGALFAPEAYQYFPYFAVAFTVTLVQTVKEHDAESGPVAALPKRGRHFLEFYADRGTTRAVVPVR